MSTNENNSKARIVNVAVGNQLEHTCVSGVDGESVDFIGSSFSQPLTIRLHLHLKMKHHFEAHAYQIHFKIKSSSNQNTQTFQNIEM